jgi:hypothetical protein
MNKILFFFLGIFINSTLAQLNSKNFNLDDSFSSSFRQEIQSHQQISDGYFLNSNIEGDDPSTMTITKYWINAGIGKCYFGPTLKIGMSYEYNQNIFSFRYLKADEFRFSAGGYNFEDPPLKFYEIAVLYGYPYRVHNMTISLLAGIGYINGIERGMLIQNRLYESIKISQLSIPVEVYFKIEPFKYVSLGITGFGNINAKRSFFGGMIELSIGNF